MKWRRVNMRNKSKNFNEKEWRNKLKKAHNFALHKMDEIKQELESLIKDIDPVEVLSHISLLSQFFPEGKSESNQDLRDKPILHFLAGLCLKNGNHSARHPENQEIEKIIKLLDEYFIYYLQELIFQSAKKEQAPEIDFLILSTRLQKIISQIKSSIYPFQLEDLLKNVFGKFDYYFIKKVGFSIADALIFGQKIIKRYKRLLNKRRDEAREAQERAKEELKDPIKGHQLLESLQEKNVTEEIITFYLDLLMFTLLQEIFVFTVDEFCKDEKIKETGKFENYLKALSCKFGEVNKDFNSPLDENVIITKPIINIDGNRYFSPIPQDLVSNLPIIFESFLEEEKQRQTQIWQKYQKQKSRYTEDKIYECFSRLFPKQNIFKNLKYIYQGQEFEVDLLINFDNKIFIIESKAGALTEPAKRGAINRLKTDLKKLIEEAYQQGRRVRNYVKFTQNPVFKDKSGKEVFNVKFKPNKIDFFLINVTLEPLMSLATGLKQLQSLGLFENNEYPWSVNLFELDIITRHIPSPTIFIHYLEKRLSAQDENIFHSFDELTFFGWYLEKGNFYVPTMDEGKTPNFVSLDGSWVAIFDDHYLEGKDAPKLKIEPDLVKIIRILEVLHPVGYSNIASALLDFNHQARELILRKMNELINKTKKDLKKHDFTEVFNEILDTGFTFITQCGRKGLREGLDSYCVMKKYQMKTKRWIGIGRDVLDDEWFVNEFVYLDFPWKSNPKMDELLKKYPFKRKGETCVDN